MAISTLDQYIAAAKQRVTHVRTTATTSRTALPFSVLHSAGTPGAGTLAGVGVNGAIQTDATAGYPTIAFSTGSGYLSRVEFGSTVACRISVFDCIWKGGTYAYNVSGQAISIPSAISGRCPDYPGSGTAFGDGIEMWAEIVTAMTSATAWTVACGYTNSSGSGSRTSGSPATAAAADLIAGRLLQIPLQAGDRGVQKIDSVTATVGSAAAGTFNLLLMRPLWTSGRVPIANSGDIHDMLKTGMPLVYSDSALFVVIQADSTSTGISDLVMEIASA